MDRSLDERDPSGSADGSPFDAPDSLDTCCSSDVLQFSLQHDKEWRFEPYLSVHCPVKAFRLSDLLVHIHVPDSVRQLPEKCFCHQPVERVTFGPCSLLESIGPAAFAATKITEICIPNGVRYLGELCFHGSSLKHVMFGESSLDRISPWVFSLIDISEINIPSSVRELFSNCFYKSRGLASVTFSTPSSLERIPADVFTNQTSIVVLTIPDSVRHLGDKCFFECENIRKVVFGISSSLTCIGVRAFEGTLLSELNIPDSVVEVSNQCFYNCERLKRVTFGESSRLERIGTMCFAMSGLETFRMPVSVTSVGGGAFNGCPLEGGFHYSDECSFRVIGNLLVDKSERVCISCLGLVRDVVIPDSVRELCDKCFYRCAHPGLRDLFKPSPRVTFGVSSQLERMGSRCFACCYAGPVEMPPSVKSVGYGIVDNPGLDSKSLCSDECMFCARDGLLLDKSVSICYGIRACVERIVVPDSVRELRDRCFYRCDYLRYVYFGISCSLERIGAQCFTGSPIEHFVMPPSVRTIGSGAFYGCPLRDGIDCSENECAFRVSGNLLLDASGTICHGAFGNSDAVFIPDSVRELCDRCFYKYKRLRSLKFSLSPRLERIGSQCFAFCPNLHIRIPESVRFIGDGAFDGCHLQCSSINKHV